AAPAVAAPAQAAAAPAGVAQPAVPVQALSSKAQHKAQHKAQIKAQKAAMRQAAKERKLAAKEAKLAEKAGRAQAKLEAKAQSEAEKQAQAQAVVQAEAQAVAQAQAIAPGTRIQVKRGVFSRLAASMSKDAPGSLWKRLAFLAVIFLLIWGGYLGYQKWGHDLAVKFGLAKPQIIMPGDITSPLGGDNQPKQEGPPDWGPLLRPGESLKPGAASSIGSNHG
ncbi:MAG: hypothetical protein K9K66_13700, partial [Desulfarculaceae bacterium]|nr:hypothetical protein [Desulfarculaceae bacterium]